MTRATTRRDSSNLQFQKRVPADVVARAEGCAILIMLPAYGTAPEAVVKVTVGPVAKFSLRVRDPAAAKMRTGTAIAQLERFYEGLRNGPIELDDRTIFALSGEVYRRVCELFERNPGEPEDWEAWKGFTWAAIEGRVTNPPALSWCDFMHNRHAAIGHFGVDSGPELLDAIESVPPGDAALSLEVRFGLVTNYVLDLHGVVVTPNCRLKLLRQVAEAALDAGWAMKRATQGDYTPDPKAKRFPPITVKTSGGSLSLTGLFDAWWEEARRAGRKPSTHESYRNTVGNLVRFLKHDDATRVTPTDVVAFKDHRLTTPLRSGRVPSAKTVKDSDLSALKTLFGWAVVNHKLPTNPATGITIKLGKPPRLRSKGFTDAEALAILTAAYHYVNEKERPCTPLRSAGCHGSARSRARGSARWRSCAGKMFGVTPKAG